MNRRHQFQLSVLLLVGLLLWGCPDPQKNFDDYLDRVEAAPTPDMFVPQSGCGPFEDPTGTYFVSVDTNIAPGTPLLFEGEFVVNTEVEPKTAQLTLYPLTVTDQTKIEDLPDRAGDAPIVSDAVPIDDEGKFELPLGNVIVTGDANPVSGSEIEADLTIQGQILSRNFVCGSVVGMLIRPSEFDLSIDGGSSFAMKPACGRPYAELTPTVRCMECDDVAALSCDGTNNGGSAGNGGDAGSAGGAAGTGGDAGSTGGTAGTGGDAGATGGDAGAGGAAGAAGAAGTGGDAGATGGDAGAGGAAGAAGAAGTGGDAGAAGTAGSMGGAAGTGGDAGSAGTSD